MVDSNFNWPADPDGQALPFVGQIDFADVSRVCSDRVFPSDGLLALFYDFRQQPSGYEPRHRGRWAVSYSRSPSSLASPPEGADIRIPDLELAAVGDLTLPESDSIEIEKLGLSPDETDAYESVLDDLKALHGVGVHRTIHRVQGWPDAIQHDPAILAQLASNGLDARDPSTYQLESAKSLLEYRDAWRLVAQIDSEDSIGLLWGLYGRVYFMMKGVDLRRRAWDAAWVVLQWS